MYSIFKCQFCSGSFSSHKGNVRRTCANKRICDHCKECWLNESNIYKSEILAYLSNAKLKNNTFDAITKIIQNITLTDERSISTSLIDIDTSKLRQLKAAFPFESKFGKLLIDEEFRRGDADKIIYREYEFPDDLPPELLKVAKNYYEYLKSRLETLTANGRPRKEGYLCREMSNCMPLLRYLASKGLTSWESYTDNHLTGFLAEKQQVLTSNIKRFIKYQNTKNPFFNNRGYHKKRSGSVLVEKPLCKVMDKTELDAFMENVKSNYSQEYYLIAWLVTHFGISYKDAVNTTLDQFKINDKGEILYIANKVWVRLPNSIQKALLSIAKNFSGSIKLDRDYLKQVHIFDLTIRTSDNTTLEIFRGRVTVLRHTAIYNMLFYQKLDRKTISYISGVSMKTIENVEALLSVTHNCSLPAEVVKKRNKMILGEA